MIVCSCNFITEKDIEASVRDLLRDDPWRLVVPVQVYHNMSRRGKCCGCFPNVYDIIIRTTEAVHREIETPEAEIILFIGRIRREHEQCETARMIARKRLAAVRAA